MQQPSTRFLTAGRLSLTVLVLSLMAVMASSGCNSTDRAATSRNPQPKAPGPAVVKPPTSVALTALPPLVLNAELQSLNGQPIKLSDYSGKVLIVNLWATWCGPCRIEVPELVRLYKEYQSRGVEVVGLSTENPTTSADLVRNFVREHNVNYKVGWASREVAIALMQGRDAIPQSFVIGRDGRILKRFVGFSRTNTPLQLKETIEEALSRSN